MSSWPAEGPRVLIMNAYSAGNAGDGLLVELATETVHRALPGADVRVVASDAASFGDHRVVQWRGPRDTVAGSLRGQRLGMITASVVGPAPELRRLVEQADLVLGVGGGYLRGGHLRESGTSFAAHVGQIRLAAAAAERTVYLPQSIGPFQRAYAPVVRRALAPMRMVCVRDDRSVVTLAGLDNVHRVPDLAVLALGRRPPQRRSESGGRPVFVARELGRPRTYGDLVQQAADSKAFDWAVQSVGRGNDDLPLTRRLSGEDVPPRLAELLVDGPSRVVVSTRLHGSLSSIMAGHPTVHLSYERKGWGAFEDLGLADHVVNARDATLPQVMALVEQIEADPEAYWRRVHAGLDSIRDQDRVLISALADACRMERVQ